MGVPAYFSHILKEHANILVSKTQMIENVKIIHRLYMDCNSIIYDSYRELLQDNSNPTYQEIIQSTIHSIRRIIKDIKPSKTIYIAFDGVAPYAKMKQQRMRRFKNEYMKESNNTQESKYFDLYMITPGTKFMMELSKNMQEEFKMDKNIILSTSNEVGEGEHKMMDHFREHVTKKENVAIYGLDSDLIMLAIFHHHITKNVYVFREAPEFFKSKIPITFQHPKEPYFIDIQQFILQIQSNYNMPAYDYVFLCFLFGNDFLPHFPVLNLRTRAVQVIQDIYHNMPNKYKPIIEPPNTKTKNQTNNWKIKWQSFYSFIHQLAMIEHELFLQEYELKERYERRYFPETTEEEREISLQHVPQQFRSKEIYIDPQTIGWESRYYKVLFPKNILKENIVKNYIEGLEWVFEYYTKSCKNWKWSYKYNYPPLIRDILQYIPLESYPQYFLLESNQEHMTQKEQMEYVLPVIAKYKEGLIKNQEYQELWNNEKNIKFEWAFCKYMWESYI